MRRGKHGGTEAVMPIRNTFRAERDGRFNWSSYRTVVLHVTERGVIVALFLPPPLIIISLADHGE